MSEIAAGKEKWRLYGELPLETARALREKGARNAYKMGLTLFPAFPAVMLSCIVAAIAGDKDWPSAALKVPFIRSWMHMNNGAYDAKPKRFVLGGFTTGFPILAAISAL